MTTGNRPAPYRIPVAHSEKNGLILLDQIRSVDKQRLVKCFGFLDPHPPSATLNTLGQVFAE